MEVGGNGAFSLCLPYMNMQWVGQWPGWRWLEVGGHDHKTHRRALAGRMRHMVGLVVERAALGAVMAILWEGGHHETDDLEHREQFEGTPCNDQTTKPRFTTPTETTTPHLKSTTLFWVGLFLNN